jgi:hypothetical protein
VTIWWWIEPMAMTGLVGVIVAGIIALFTWETGDKLGAVATAICALLLIPIVVSFLGGIACFFHHIFWIIWHPYF